LAAFVVYLVIIADFRTSLSRDWIQSFDRAGLVTGRGRLSAAVALRALLLAALALITVSGAAFALTAFLASAGRAAVALTAALRTSWTIAHLDTSQKTEQS
jgi:hypothetical protein